MRRRYEGLADAIVRLMHRQARPMTAGAVSLYFNLSLEAVLAELDELQHLGKVIPAEADGVQTWLLTERPSVRVGNDDPDGPPSRM